MSLPEIELGNDPQPLTVRVAAGADFVSTIRKTDGVWDPATVVELRFGAVTWTATIVGNEIRFNVDKVLVAPVLALRSTPAQLFYTLGAVELLWATGNIEVTS